MNNQQPKPQLLVVGYADGQRDTIDRLLESANSYVDVEFTDTESQRDVAPCAVLLNVDALDGAARVRTLSSLLKSAQCPILVLGHRIDRPEAQRLAQAGAWLIIHQETTSTEQLTALCRLASERAVATGLTDRFEKIAAGLDSGIFDVDLDRGLAFYSQRWHEIVTPAAGIVDEYSSESHSLTGCLLAASQHGELSTPDYWFRHIHPDDLGEVLSALDDHFSGVTAYFESAHRLCGGVSQRWVLARGVADRSGRRIAGALTDITERKELERQLAHDSFYDTLTGLPNRANFCDRLGVALGRARRHGDYQFAVLLVDLDRFQTINDSLGRHVGNHLLSVVGDRLRDGRRTNDLVCRVRGDVFAVLLDHIRHPKDASRVAERIQQQLDRGFLINDVEVFTSASIGIALSGQGYESADEVLRDAEIACSRAKEQGRSGRAIFDPIMHERVVELLQVETDLRRAVDRNEFVLNYQPIVSLENGDIVGFEALVRWHHPERGVVGPNIFIPVAEETGMIVPIGAWVLEEACRTLSGWRKRFKSAAQMPISVNLSACQFRDEDLVKRVQQALKFSGIAPGQLKLELTESTIMDNAERSLETLRELKHLGVHLHIDDFGTGYSSLSYLTRFPIDTLKIDRSFVSGVNVQEENAKIVGAVLLLARSLGIEVTAEGVETHEELQKLRSLSCVRGQGYFFSRPVPAEDVELMLGGTPNWKRAITG